MNFVYPIPANLPTSTAPVYYHRPPPPPDAEPGAPAGPRHAAASGDPNPHPAAPVPPDAHCGGTDAGPAGREASPARPGPPPSLGPAGCGGEPAAPAPGEASDAATEALPGAARGPSDAAGGSRPPDDSDNGN